MIAADIILEDIKRTSERVFGEKLVGVYVHGSYAFGCFHPEKSDIDFIVVTSSSPNIYEKIEYISEILRINAQCPPKGIEMSVVLEKYCENFVHPTPYELHYSNTHLECASSDMRAYCEKMHGTDRDLAAHFTVINAVGITLCGKDKDEVFRPVPSEAYADSLRYDAENASENIFSEPVYVILNLCRTLAFVFDGKIMSKAGGGEWGKTKLPEKYRGLAEKALKCYVDGKNYDCVTERELLSRFAEYASEKIFEKKEYGQNE